jgi:hypothetical protein
MLFDPRLLSAALDDSAFPVLDHLMEYFAPEAPYLSFGSPGAARTLSAYGRTVLAYRDPFRDPFDGERCEGVEVRTAGPWDPLVFPAQRFGLVHARWIKFDPATLSSLVRWLRPGGVLLIESPDDYPAAVIRTGPYRAVAQAVTERLKLESAHDLPARLIRHGLEHVGCRHEAPDRGGFHELLKHFIEQGTPWPEVHPADLRDWMKDPVARTSPAMMNVLAWGLKADT